MESISNTILALSLFVALSLGDGKFLIEGVEGIHTHVFRNKRSPDEQPHDGATNAGGGGTAPVDSNTGGGTAPVDSNTGGGTAHVDSNTGGGAAAPATTNTGGGVGVVKKKKRTHGWAYEATLSRCAHPRAPGKWKIENIAMVGKRKKCNRGINIREEKEGRRQYLLKQIEEQNKP